LNLNTHILFGMAIGAILFNKLDLLVLVGIGAALPDLDREYILTNKLSLAKHQLHRALFHNIFFVFGVFLLNYYLGIGVLSHILLDMMTSPADRGAEIFFPLDRLKYDFHIDLDGVIKEKRGVMWYIEDPLRVIRGISDKDLTPPGKSPWIRVYGPFKNSRIVDWAIFYSSVIFLILYNQADLFAWFIQLLFAIYAHLALFLGIIVFYTGGEIWRRKLQATGKGRTIIAAVMMSGVAGIVYGVFKVLSPPTVSTVDITVGIEIIVSVVAGTILSFIHAKRRQKNTVM
jgi:hypothetical protein